MNGPATLSVKQRVETMISSAKQRFGCSLTINQSNRSAEQAQQFHVCHMFLHNFFKNIRPKNLAGNGRTIDWQHLSDPTLNWALIANPESLFLFTKQNRPAQKEVINGVVRWVAGSEPDEKATTLAMEQFLKRHHVTSMAAPGQDRCGEPCSCGGHASKHITGLACDVGGMETLGQTLLSGQAGYQTADEAVDHFLAEFQLWRPLAHLPGKAREAWHLEALPVHHARPPKQKAPRVHLHKNLSRDRHGPKHCGC
jgi:hypothetical protein